MSQRNGINGHFRCFFHNLWRGFGFKSVSFRAALQEYFKTMNYFLPSDEDLNCLRKLFPSYMKKYIRVP